MSQHTTFDDFKADFELDTGLKWKDNVPTYLSYLNYRLEFAKSSNIFQMVNRLDLVIDELQKITKKLPK